uniref:Mitogen-activated protein kinase 8 interacting protein 2 n=1 Tax=Chelonoidis abingdonii TaxID=106734 RepID=A0A8C0H968_CHEAB
MGGRGGLHVQGAACANRLAPAVWGGVSSMSSLLSSSSFHPKGVGTLPPQDISLEEFDDEDLSEITDDCGIGLNYDSDHYEKDGLVLERCEQPHPICTFSEDFQEFEMIDDNEEEEEADGTGLDMPPSPSASPIPSPSTEETQKPRPSTLSLSVPGAQVRGLPGPPLPSSVFWPLWLELAEQLSSEGEGPHCSRAASMRGLPSGSSETTSPSSDPGIEADLTSRNSKQFLPRSRHSDDLSSPGSDSDVEGEIEAAFACGGHLVSNMISSISETELDLSSDSSSGRSSHLTNSIEEASSPTSEAELETELEGQGLMGIKDSLLLDKYSDSESEPDLSEDSDSPWLLSNLVNKMILEGSYPLKCPDECFQQANSLCDTISPASDLEPEILSESLDVQPSLRDSPGSEEELAKLACSQQSIELVDMETLRSSLQSAEDEKPTSTSPATESSPPGSDSGPYLFMSNPTNDTITPVFLGHPLSIDRLGSSRVLSFEEDLPLPPPPVAQEPQPLDESLVYDSIKYTLVVDENTQLELVSLKRCTSVLSDDSELLRACDNCELEDEDEFGEGLTAQDGQSSSEDSSPEADLQFSKKFLNVFVNSTSRSSSTESFGLFSCMVNGEEREQTHRAVFRFIPRHEDELELDVDDPILVELEEDDYWYRGYNMRTGERGIFPAFYAHEVVSQAKEVIGLKRNPSWVERFNVQFLGSVEVPYHQGNGILCAAMQKIATTRKLTVHLRPPATCDLKITLQGIKLILTYERCSHFFQMKNISFCGCHPRNSCYFGFITKHPVLSRFACHVFVSQESMRHVAECVGRAVSGIYRSTWSMRPTEDIYLE